jgi:hypothetical protein
VTAGLLLPQKRLDLLLDRFPAFRVKKFQMCHCAAGNGWPTEMVLQHPQHLRLHRLLSRQLYMNTERAWPAQFAQSSHKICLASLR